MVHPLMTLVIMFNDQQRKFADGLDGNFRASRLIGSVHGR